MSTHSSNNSDNQEIDLSAITRGIGNTFQRMNSFLYHCIRFVIRNIVILGILLVGGMVLGTLLDSGEKSYENQIIVSPNFGSVDYLYSKIDLIDAKIKERDTFFLKSIGIKTPKDLLNIKISPIVDVYKFVNNSEQNYKLLELMAGDGDIKKIVAENATSKNYTYHVISYTTKGMTTQAASIKPILDYLNNSEFYLKLQKEYLNNVHNKIRQDDIIIAQIDGVLNEFAKNSESGNKNEKLVYYNENTQLNDVIKTKDDLIKEEGNLRLDLVSLDKIIKDNSIVANIRRSDTMNGKMKLIIPMMLIFIFLTIYFFRAFYKKQSLKHANK